MLRAFLLMLGVLGLCASCSRPGNLERIVSDTSGRDGGAAVPPDTVVLGSTNAVDLVSPVVRLADSTAVAGMALAIPEGAGSLQKRGRATFSFALARDGTYEVWARVRWQDSCGNSFSIQIDDSPGRMVGQDAVYSTWHWVKAGTYKLSAQRHRLAVQEREDGVAIDQWLVTPDPGFVPGGPILPGTAKHEIRQFADDFARSPGHGMEAWDLVSGKWGISFSLDPNRIPDQYSLVGEAGQGGTSAVALVSGPPWKGCSLAFSILPTGDGTFGAVLDRSADGSQALSAAIEMTGSRAALQVRGPGFSTDTDVSDAVKSNQWHRLVIERWAWALRVTIDGRAVLETFELAPPEGGVGLLVGKGGAAFDDVVLDEIPWQAEHGGGLQIPWVAAPESAWYRARKQGDDLRMVGRGGTIRTSLPGLSVQEILLQEVGGAPCLVRTPGVGEVLNRGGLRAFRRLADAAEAPSSAVFEAARGTVKLGKVGIRYGSTVPEFFRLGLYHFTTAEIEDPSDYLDFTPEEYRQIENSPEADKLRRQKKYKRLIGNRGYGVWNSDEGTWWIQQGVLIGRGPGAALQYWDELPCPLTVRMKVRLSATNSVAELELYGGSSGGLRVRMTPEGAPVEKPAAGVLALSAGAVDRWQEVEAGFAGGVLKVRLNGQVAGKLPFRAEAGGRLTLRVPRGNVWFDDIELLIPRTSAREFFYAFDQRETDWWREGGTWTDHGGIACLSGSNWISLMAPGGEGMLWNKRRLGSDLLVAFKIEENTEWLGWNQHPSHIHHGFDNIRVCLTPANDRSRGYRLEVNARNHSATVLYRDGKEVKSAAQDGSFPIRYIGGDAPYHPRRNSILFMKSGRWLTAVVNGQEVLKFEDPEPLSVDTVGLGGYRTHVNFAEVAVRELPASR